MKRPDAICSWISALYKYNQFYMARQLEPYDIGPGQYPFILAVCREPGISQDSLTEALFLNKSTIARAISNLEENGFLTREVNPSDKRAYCLYPTEKAEQSVDVIHATCADCARIMTEGLTEDERLQAAELLSRMAKNVKSISSYSRK